ncbi:MAG TPA: transglycosylase domain-containing protein, partial [Burkholderiaceae bacterium]|nr:transglycosylase domain-containing protein [Burkholderiaceae bacterium]
MSTRRRIEIVLAGLLLLLLALDQAFAPPVPADDRGTVVLARDGTPLRTWPGTDGVWRHSVTPEEVSPLYLDALLAYEDRWFYWHPGVNPFALGRASWQWLRQGRVVSGGSTLTMQVARMLDPPAPLERRTLKAKLRQLLRALQLELRLSKREILMLYLDHAPMGGIVEGVEMASRAYLGKSSRDLGVAEAALLAGLPQSPSRLRPDRAPDAARAARDKVLDRMVRLGRWSQAMVDDARIERVAVLPIRGQWLAPLAAERVRQISRQRGRPRQPVLRTTIDPELQSTVERVLL